MTDIPSIISRMTLEEKAALCTGANAWGTTPIERLGVPELFVADGPHGVRRVTDVNALMQTSLPATCFPTASCLASTWNADLARQMGKALAEECVALKVDVLLGPCINIIRSPLGGRSFEQYSEDPYLTGELSAALIGSIQAGGVGTSLKHFAVNNQEYQRFCIDAKVDERALREIYLSAFETAVRKSQPWTVMCAYNKLNGEFCSQHRELLDDILKREWGFEGLVVSDWGAVRDRVAALAGGLDWEMPGPREAHVKAVVDAVRGGTLDIAVLDEAVRRILRVVFKAAETPKGVQTPAGSASPKGAGFDAEAHHALARRIAAEGMVLLKNDGILPLSKPRTIAVIGRSAKVPHFQGGGSSHINPTRLDIPIDELKAQAAGAALSYSEGYPADDSFRRDLIDEAVAAARAADVALLFAAMPAFKESESYDRTDLDLTAQQVALIQAVSRAQPRTVVVLNNGAAVAVGAWIDTVAAVLEGWMMGQAGGGALVDILFGKINPSGKLGQTFPRRLVDTPAHINWPGGYHEVLYGEGLYVGYRYYDAKDVPVQFPFGFGLSYTSFAYGPLKTSAASFKDMDGVGVSVDVTNAGKMPGKEIVQLYVHDRKSALPRPPKELKGFAKVDLAPGETKTVTFRLDARAFAYYHPGYKRWIAEDGDFDILVGASAADIRSRATVTLQSTTELPCILDRESTLREWLDDPRGQSVLGPHWPEIKAFIHRNFGGDQGVVGMNIFDMVADMPLVSVLLILAIPTPKPAEEWVPELLKRVQ